MTSTPPVIEGTDELKPSDQADESPSADEAVDAGDLMQAASEPSTPPDSELTATGASDAPAGSPDAGSAAEEPAAEEPVSEAPPSVPSAPESDRTSQASLTATDEPARAEQREETESSAAADDPLSDPAYDPSSGTDIDKLMAHLLEPPRSSPEPLSVRDIEEDLTNAVPERLTGRDIELEITPDSNTSHDPDEEPLSLRDIEEDLTPDPVEPPPQEEPVPLVARKRTIPPPLPPRLERPGLSGPPLVAATSTQLAGSMTQSLVRTMIDRLAASDYEGAFMTANTLLRKDSRMDDALQTAHIARAELYRIYDGRLGSRDRRPSVFVPTEELQLYPLDARGALVLSRVDGSRTIDDIINSGILPKLETLRILSEMFLQGILGFDEPRPAPEE